MLKFVCAKVNAFTVDIFSIGVTFIINCMQMQFNFGIMYNILEAFLKCGVILH